MSNAREDAPEPEEHLVDHGTAKIHKIIDMTKWLGYLIIQTPDPMTYSTLYVELNHTMILI